MRTTAVIAALLLSACTTIGHVPAPADRPHLTVTVHRVSNWQLLKTCYQAVPLWLKLLGGIANGCAFIDLSKMSCDIYVHEQSPDDDPTLLHELDHCQLRDHFGSSQLADLWAGYKAHMTRAGRYCYVRHDGQNVCVGNL